MNCYGGKDLAAAFRTVRKNTILIAQDIPEDKYSYRAAPDVRSVGELLTHIALSTSFPYQFHAVDQATTMAGLDFPTLFAEYRAKESVRYNKEQTLELLRVKGEEWATWLDGLSDDFLAVNIAMPAGAPYASKSRFEMVMSAKEHEMHHRGQLMLIERQLGIVPHLTREMQARFAAGAAAAAAQK
jgi:uncharacterized damage-inducible protein DinB